MNTSTMDESASGSALFTTADLAKTSPNTNSMSLLSLTNAVVRGSAASGTPFPVVSSTCGGGDEQSSQELKVSDLSNVAGLKKVAKHVGEESHSKKNRSKSLSPRRESSRARISKSRDLSPRRESSVRNNTKGKSRRGERSFDVKAAASMLASPNAKEDKASAAAAFLLSTTQAAATTRSVSPDLENHRARHRPHHHKKEDNHHQGLDSRGRHNNKEDRRRSKSEHRRSLPVKEDNSLDRRSEHHHKKPNSRLPRRSQRDDGAEHGEELKRERIRRRHHHHHQHHNRRTQSQPEGSMTKPPNVKPRRVASQPEGGALDEAAAQVMQKGRPHRGNGRSVRGTRSGGARGMGNVQLQQVLKMEINKALEVELEDDVGFAVRPPPPTRIEKGMDLNTVDLTSLDADAVNKLLAQSMHNNNKSGETTTTHKSSSSSNIVLPMTASKQTSTSRRNRMGISKRASGSSNRHLTAGRKAKHSDLSDDSEDEFA